jgi:hypothetical protein
MWAKALGSVVVALALATGCTAVAPPRPLGVAERVDALFAVSVSGRYERVADVLVVVNGKRILERHRHGSPAAGRVIDGVTGAVLALLVGAAHDRRLLPAVDAPLGDLAPERPSSTLHGLLVGAGDTTFGPLAGVLERAGGRPLPALAAEWLFDPLGIDPRWTPDGRLAVDAEDMAALGGLLLGHGRVHGRQVISAAWLDLAARPYSVTGRSWLPYVGYGQWLTRVGGHAASVVTGAEGQLLEVVPGLGMVVVVTSGDPPAHTVANAPSEAFVEVVSGLIAPALA